MHQNDSPRPRNGEGLTPPEARRRDYEQLKELFGLDVSYDDVINDKHAPRAALIRHVLMWAQIHSKAHPSLPKTARMFGRKNHTTVLGALQRLNLRAAKSPYPLFDEKLELLLETALRIADHEEITSGLKERVAAFREKEKAANLTRHLESLRLETQRRDVSDSYQTSRRIGREMKALEMIKEGKNDADIRKSIGVSSRALNMYKESLVAQGLLAGFEKKKRGSQPGPRFRGKSENGDTLLALDTTDLAILQMVLDGKPFPEIRDELEKRGIKMTTNAVAGHIWRTFGGIKKASKDRLHPPKEPGGEWVYEKPAKE